MSSTKENCDSISVELEEIRPFPPENQREEARNPNLCENEATAEMSPSVAGNEPDRSLLYACKKAYEIYLKEKNKLDQEFAEKFDKTLGQREEEGRHGSGYMKDDYEKYIEKIKEIQSIPFRRFNINARTQTEFESANRARKGKLTSLEALLSGKKDSDTDSDHDKSDEPVNKFLEVIWMEDGTLNR